MSWSRVRHLVLKDWVETRRNSQAVIPLVLVPFLLVILLPVLLLSFPDDKRLRVGINGLEQFVDNIPATAIPPEVPLEAGALYAILVYFFAPVFLIIPVVSAMVIGSVSFAGEKERKTLEGLLYCPLTSKELLVGKVLVSFVPALLLTWLAFSSFAVIVNLMGSKVFGSAILPTLAWFVLGAALAPGVALLVVIVVVGVSMRCVTVQNAQAAAAVLVLPVVSLVVAQTLGAVLFDLNLALALALAVWLVALFALVILTRRFSREMLVLRL